MKVQDGRVGCAGKEGNYTLQSQTLGWQLQRGVTKLELFENSNCLTCNAESDYATTNIARSPTPGRLILYWVLINVLSFYKCLLYKASYKLYHFQFISVANQIFSKVEICKLKRESNLPGQLTNRLKYFQILVKNSLCYLSFKFYKFDSPGCQTPGSKKMWTFNKQICQM